MRKSITKKNVAMAIGLLLITNLLTYCITVKEVTEEPTLSEDYADHCHYNVKRQTGFKYIRPLLLVDSECESEKLSTIKQNLSNTIDEYKKTGELSDASVYLKEYNDNEWMAINADEKYLPGSLMKVPQLITFLKMEEARPGTLDRKLTYSRPFDIGKSTIYTGKSIQLGHSYTIRELLNYMIVESDNAATSLLFINMDSQKFKEVFTDMGLETPNLSAANIPISVKEFSIFMRVLYNSSYLTNKNSEFATELMSKSKFTQGLVSGLANDVKVAHKFGEAGNGTESYLNESAIVYLQNNPYILTVMTKAKNPKKLPEIIKQFSAIVYQNMRDASQKAS